MRIANCALALALVACVAAAADSSPKLPDGYRLIYSQDFSSEAAIKDFEFSDAKAWKFATHDGNGCLELLGGSKYKPPFRSPLNIALIAGKAFGDFILEADLMQTGKEYGHRDMCLFFGFRGPSAFYYCHIATKADDHAHNVMIVNGAPRTKISKKTTAGIDWGSGKWHHVRLERRPGDGAIRLFYDDMKEPMMIAGDKTHGAGGIGFGSFDDSGRVDNIKIWSPSAPEKAASFFK